MALVAVVTDEPQASDSLGATRAWAVGLHGSQKDKMGLPYATHLDAVCLNLYELVGFDQEHLMIALLHDVMEDCHVTERQLVVQGYSPRVVDGVVGMTKRNGERNPDYVSRVIASGVDVMLVKLADLYHNTEEVRLSKLTEVVQDRLRKKYYAAIWRLEQELMRQGILEEGPGSITFEQALAAVRKPVAPTGDHKNWKPLTSVTSVFPGDSVREVGDGHVTYKVASKRTSHKGSLVIVLASGREVVFTKDQKLETKWGFGTTTGTGWSTSWKDYLGLGPEWKEGDPV